MRWRLQTKEGRAIYGKRKSTIEPTFGIIKQVMGYRQFLVRGFDEVSAEWDLVCIAFNLKRMFKLMQAKGIVFVRFLINPYVFLSYAVNLGKSWKKDLPQQGQYYGLLVVN